MKTIFLAYGWGDYSRTFHERMASLRNSLSAISGVRVCEPGRSDIVSADLFIGILDHESNLLDIAIEMRQQISKPFQLFCPSGKVPSSRYAQLPLVSYKLDDEIIAWVERRFASEIAASEVVRLNH